MGYFQVKECLLKNWHTLGQMVLEEVGTYNAICHNATPNVQGLWMLMQDCSHPMRVYIRPIMHIMSINLSNIYKHCFIRKYQIICKQRIKVKLSTHPITKVNDL